jgi:hypothetical protein
MAHPLSDFVMSAFTPEHEHHDRITIACFMAGASTLRIPNSEADGMDVYILVAEGVLGCLVEGGRLQLDAAGWHVVRGAISTGSLGSPAHHASS